MKRKNTLSIIASAVILIVLILLLLPGDNSLIDRLFLLERREPSYWEYLGPDQALQVRVWDGFSEIPREKLEQDNLLQEQVLRDNLFGNFGGVIMKPEDGLLLISGTAEKNVWKGVDLSSLSIEKGTYFISMGENVPEPGTFYVEAIRNGIYYRICDVAEQNYFYVDPSRYETYKFTVAVQEGSNVDLTVYPMICKISGENILSRMSSLILWKNVPKEKISARDEKIFLRSLSQYRYAEACVVSYEDGTMEAYRDFQKVSAERDDLGMIVLGGQDG